ncbi:hypothetical protein ACFSUS_09395 [Spirosoma soli]|uniref:Arm DNA-binding domain-containing protein n=1 Tax=Spirosoma soli TaxID=1770529 RepID=A0ABW5M1D6_9BACT
MKPTVNNVINLWFGAETPIREYKIKLNPKMWAACQRVSQSFTPPSGIKQADLYRKSDKIAFAKSVLEELDKTELSSKATAYELA